MQGIKVVMARKNNSSPPIDWRLKLPADLAEQMDDLIERRGSDRTKSMARIVEWFLGLPEIIQQDALGQLPEENRQDIAQMILKQMTQAQPPLNMRSAAKSDIKPKTGGRR